MPVATITTTDHSLLHLMRLSSASLPVGGYSFSQGLEYAVESGWVTSKEETADWLRLILLESIAQVDLPILQRLITALENNSTKAFWFWNTTLLACRETKELLLTETAMGEALVRLLNQLQREMPAQQPKDVSFIAAFAVATEHWQVNLEAAKVGYLWSWLENQIAAATKLVPLGQTVAQQLLIELGNCFPEAIKISQTIADNEIGSSLPGMAMASSWHETQYSRLFRS